MADTLTPDSYMGAASTYNTRLTPAEELQFAAWKSKNAPKDSGEDYDLRGAFKADLAGQLFRDSRGHTTDKFKKPNHPTFSNQSQYSGVGGNIGGIWGKQNGRDTFTPSSTNLKYHKQAELQDYFKSEEPNSQLIIPPANNLSPDEYMRETDHAIASGNPVFNEEGKLQPPEAADKFRYYIGRHLANALPAALATAGTRFGVKGAMGGAAAGSYGANAARSFFPRLFGSPSDTPNQDAVLDTVGQGIVPEVLGSVGSKVAQGAMDFAQGGLPGLAHSIMASKVVSRFSPSVRNAVAADRAATESSTLTNKIQQMMQPPLQENPSAEIALANKEGIQRYGTNRGPDAFEQQQIRETVQARNAAAAKSHEQVTSLIHEGYSPATGSFNGAKILDRLAKNPSEYTGIDPNLRSNLEELAKAQVAAKTPATSEKVTSPVLRYVKNRLVFDIPGAAVGALTGHTGAGIMTGEALATTVTLSEMGISKLMSNPETAALVVKAIKTPSTAPEATFVGALLKHALRGQEVLLTTPDEKNQKAIVGEDGKLQYPPPSSR